MLDVTDKACEKLAAMLNDFLQGVPESPRKSEIALRLTFDDELRFHSDVPRDGDETYEHDGQTVLLLDERMAEALEENTLDLNADGTNVALK